MYLAALGIDVTAVDISAASLARARKRAPKVGFVRGTVMALPFSDARFDAIVSDGVIHHTPNARAAFAENARILRPGGYLYLGLYNRRRYYYYIYTYAGPPIRWLDKSAAGRTALGMTLIPLYYLVHLAKSRGRRSWGGGVFLIADWRLRNVDCWMPIDECGVRSAGLSSVDCAKRSAVLQSILNRQ